jgi:hypothetical protein
VNCVICTEAAADRWTICARCEQRISDNLAAIVVLTRAAALHLTPERRGGTPGAAVPGSRPPLSVDALDDSQAADALPILESWERLWREHAQMAPYGPVSALRTHRGAITPPATLEAVTAFLRAQLARMAETPDYPLDDMADEVKALHRKLSRYDANNRGPQPGVPVACPSDHPDNDGRKCSWRLWTDGTGIVVCPQCQTHWCDDTLLDAHDMDLLPTDVLILLDPDHPDPRKRIKNWAARNRLTEHASAPNPAGGHPIPLYRLGEYRNLLSTTRATKAQPDLTMGESSGNLGLAHL